MTREEAIEIIRGRNFYCVECVAKCVGRRGECCKALDMAISALEKEQPIEPFIPQEEVADIMNTIESAEYFKKSEVLEMQHELVLLGHSKMIIDVSDIEQLPTYSADLVKESGVLVKENTENADKKGVSEETVSQSLVKDGDLISRTELLNAIWQKEYGKDYDGVNLLSIPHIDIIENMPSAEKTAE